jgi:hypothetical protein
MPVKAAILSAFIAMAATGAHAGTVTVTFLHPEKFTDASLDGDGRMRSIEPVLAEFRAYLETLGTKDLKPDQSIAIEVTDIDLAGRCEPWGRIGYDVRIMRDVDPPRMKLNYKLMEGNQTLAEGQQTLADVNYLDDAPARLQQEPLRYDKAMLRAWFEKLVRTTAP